MVTFARALDERDWETYANTYTEDGVFAINGLIEMAGRDTIRAKTSSEQGLGAYQGTWHLSSNHCITIDGDTATLRSYLLGVHMLSTRTRDHADGAGWHDCDVVRTAERWRFSKVRISEVWHAGRALAHVPPSA